MVKYKKEKYQLSNDRVIIEKGDFFTSNNTELLYKNVVKISLLQPFVENKIFKTGSIEISSSSTSALTKIKLNSIENPKQIFETLQQKLMHSDFILSKSEIVQKEKPNVFGVALNLIFLSIFRVFGILVSLTYVLGSQTSTGGGEDAIPTFIFSAIFLTSILFTSFKFLLGILFQFLDIYYREYLLYRDCIYFHDGFLNKSYHFIPLTNISDTSTKQSFIQNLLGIYNVIASGKGSGNEIIFEQMNNGDKFEDNLNSLIKQNKAKVIDSENDQISEIESLKEVYKQDTPRALFGLILTIPLFIIIPVFFYVLKEFIKVFATKYYFDSHTIIEDYKFLQNQKYKFNIDKITSFTISKNIIDRIFNTITLHFTSFGSSRAIDFKNISETSNLAEKIKTLLKFNTKSKPLYSINAVSDLYAFLIKNLLTILSFVFIIVCLVALSMILETRLLALAAFMIGSAMIVYFISDWFIIKKQSITFFKDFLIVERGLLASEKIYVWYQDIKDINSIKYPLTTIGDIRLSIAGGQGVDEQEQTNSFSNHISLNVLPNIQNFHDTFDNILQINKFINTPIIENTEIQLKPHLLNSVFIVLIIPFLWFILPFVALKYVFTKYTLTDKRIIQTTGYIFKNKKSVLSSKIDFIDSHVLLLNHTFKTGNIIINTAGSLIPEIILQNIPEFKKISEGL
ncbi:PH domain-containing protein, partial [Candidatus Dojkabacteria bacterium]|nr:PH domain-containing protein [Candidatus Dojkabacteria bacterium]